MKDIVDFQYKAKQREAFRNRQIREERQRQQNIEHFRNPNNRSVYTYNDLIEFYDSATSTIAKNPYTNDTLNQAEFECPCRYTLYTIDDVKAAITKAEAVEDKECLETLYNLLAEKEAEKKLSQEQEEEKRLSQEQKDAQYTAQYLVNK